jgi:hypothetical protein
MVANHSDTQIGTCAPFVSQREERIAPSLDKSLLRSGGRCALIRKAVAVMDKLPAISIGEPPCAELSRWATGNRLHRLF